MDYIKQIPRVNSSESTFTRDLNYIYPGFETNLKFLGVYIYSKFEIILSLSAEWWPPEYVYVVAVCRAAREQLPYSWINRVVVKYKLILHEGYYLVIPVARGEGSMPLLVIFLGVCLAIYGGIQ